jgi:hypothetical protein
MSGHSGPCDLLSAECKGVIAKPKLPSTVSNAFMNEFPIAAPSEQTNISQPTGGLTRLSPSNLPWALLGTGTPRRSRPFRVPRDARALKAFVLDPANAMRRIPARQARVAPDLLRIARQKKALEVLASVGWRCTADCVRRETIDR